MSTLKCYAAALCLLALAQVAQAQQSSSPQPLPDAPQPAQTQSGAPAPAPTKPEHVRSAHHIFWVIPNYREDESGGVFKPLTAHEKFKVALDDSFDPSAFLVAGVFAGNSMLQRQYPQFEDGAAGFRGVFRRRFRRSGHRQHDERGAFPHHAASGSALFSTW